MKRRKMLASLGVNVLAWCLSLILLTPLLLILVNSFKTSRAASDMNLTLPASFEWSNYSLVIEKGKLGITFLNSVLYSAGSVLLCTLLCTMASYVLSRNRCRLSQLSMTFLHLRNSGSKSLSKTRENVPSRKTDVTYRDFIPCQISQKEKTRGCCKTRFFPRLSLRAQKANPVFPTGKCPRRQPREALAIPNA